jgi:S-DNA-T family DNA segregation ATPase FtsK/SpoIIIE
VTFDDVWSKVAEDAGPLFGLVGIGGDALAALGPDLGVGSSTFVVAGPRRSGRSTLLLSMARSFLAVGTQVIVVAPQPSPLRQLGSAPGVVAVFTGADLSSSDLQAALDSLRGPGAILIDDAELLKSCAAGDVLANLCRHGIDSHRALVLAGDVESVCSGFSGWQLEAKKGRRGALLGPHGISDGDLIGVRLPRRAAPTGQQTQPGRALLHLGDGELITVQVPLS